MQLIKPRLKFGIYLVENAKFNSQKSASQPHLCFAETYEIQPDGSIIFYQIGKADDKKVKVPVLSYPHGKWEACVLIDDNNDFPVFNQKASYIRPTQSNSSHAHQESHQREQPFSMPIHQMNQSKTVESSDDLTSLDQAFSNVNSGFNSTPASYGNIPGINNNQDFKKQKEAWLENEIKSYAKNNDLFLVEDFLDYLKSNPEYKTYKPQESETIWSCSKLIRAKQVMSKKFFDMQLQKTLNLILPDIMKRQWDGKMAPILQVLQDREDTKNATAIDLAVWMVQNNFE